MNKVFQCGTESILNSTKGLQAYRHKSQKFQVVTFLKNYNISHELNTEVLINWVCLRLYKLSPVTVRWMKSDIHIDCSDFTN